MTPDDAADLRRLLRERRVLTLAVLVGGAPHASLLPFAATADLAALLVLASGLARHTRGLVAGAPFAAVIHDGEGPGADPYQIARLSLEGEVEPVPREDPAFAPLGERLHAVLPEAGRLLGFGDFGLYRLVLQRGRLVAGFARACDLTPAMLAAASAS